mmetsp:Transcript_65270/g.202104  ORF Transcript_65270/g.202104 Transcript_65270/m.202104 type:complete len:543 (-) Transcript_65270:92-1720(-)
MRAAGGLLAWLAQYVAARGAETVCLAGDVGCGAPGRAPAAAPSPAPYSPFKGFDLNHSGWSPHAGPFDLSRPSWVFEEPDRGSKGRSGPVKAFHGSPMVDGELNVYIQSSTGWVYSVDRQGTLRWSADTGDAQLSNLAVWDGLVYTMGQSGHVYALDAATGRETWRSKVAKGGPSDTHSPVVYGGRLLMACNPTVHFNDFGRSPDIMSEAVCAINASTGSVLWIYDMIDSSRGRQNLATNQMHAVVNDTAVFSDGFGGVYRVSIETGEEIWYQPNVTCVQEFYRTGGMVPYGTTATMVVGPNDVIYSGFNLRAKVGALRAHDLRTGAELWSRTFQDEVNAAPAVGLLRPGGSLAVVVAVGTNPMPVSVHQLLVFCMTVFILLTVWCFWLLCRRRTSWCTCRTGLKVSLAVAFVGGLVLVRIPSLTLPMLGSTVLALDAGSGEVIWQFNSSMLGLCAGNTWTEFCVPDLWGSPAIGADGTVYVNWSGGKAFALRDANGDGVVDREDPGEASSYHHGSGSNGITAIAPGLLVAPSCRYILGWVS